MLSLFGLDRLVGREDNIRSLRSSGKIEATLSVMLAPSDLVTTGLIQQRTVSAVHRFYYGSMRGIEGKYGFLLQSECNETENVEKISQARDR
jgi:hypothetical protein